MVASKAERLTAQRSVDLHTAGRSLTCAHVRRNEAIHVREHYPYWLKSRGSAAAGRGAPRWGPPRSGASRLRAPPPSRARADANARDTSVDSEGPAHPLPTSRCRRLWRGPFRSAERASRSACGDAAPGDTSGTPPPGPSTSSCLRPPDEAERHGERRQPPPQCLRTSRPHRAHTPHTGDRPLPLAQKPTSASPTARSRSRARWRR